MTDHFHLLLRPEPGQSISRIVQSLTVAHTSKILKQTLTAWDKQLRCDMF